MKKAKEALVLIPAMMLAACSDEPIIGNDPIAVNSVVAKQTMTLAGLAPKHKSIEGAIRGIAVDKDHGRVFGCEGHDLQLLSLTPDEVELFKSDTRSSGRDRIPDNLRIGKLEQSFRCTESNAFTFTGLEDGDYVVKGVLDTIASTDAKPDGQRPLLWFFHVEDGESYRLNMKLSGDIEDLPSPDSDIEAGLSLE